MFVLYIIVVVGMLEVHCCTKAYRSHMCYRPNTTQAVQPKGGIRRFCIDPNEYSNFEIANHLWSLMEKGTYAETNSISSE